MTKMANVLFKQLTAAQFSALSPKVNTTFYRVVNTDNSEDLYIGDKKLNNGQDLLDALYAQYIEYTAASGDDPAVSVKDALDDLYSQIGAGGSVASQIAEAIDALDATVTQSAGSDGLALSVTQTDGVITAISGSIAAETYDAYGAAATAKSEVIGTNSDTASDDTIKGSKAYTDAAIGNLGTAASADVATSAIQEQSTDNNLVSAAQVSAFVASEIAGLEGAMHFIGVITRQTGETDAQAIARVVTTPEAGDTVVMSDNAKEYVYDGTAWREVGDETEFVKKTTTIAGVDLQDNITALELQTALSLGTAAYEPTSSFEAAGTAAGLIAALDADVDASGTAAHSGTFVVSGITQADGVITAVDSTEVESAGAAAALASTLATVATSGDSEDLDYDNTDSGLTSTNVQDAIDEIAGTAGSAVQSVTEGNVDLAIDVDGTSVAVHGLGSAALENANAFDPAGSASTAQSNAASYTDTAISNALTWEVVSAE